MPEEPGGMVLVYSKTTSFYTSAGLESGVPDRDQYPRWDCSEHV